MNTFKLLLVVSATLAGMLLLNYAMGFTKPKKIGIPADDNITVDPYLIVFRQGCLFFGFFLLIIPLAYLYIHISVSQKIVSSRDLKILDWGLVAFILLLTPLLEIIGIPPFLWVLLVVLPAVIVRSFITWHIQKRRRG